MRLRDGRASDDTFRVYFHEIGLQLRIYEHRPGFYVYRKWQSSVLPLGRAIDDNIYKPIYDEYWPVFVVLT